MNGDRKLFVVTFIVETAQLPPLPNGQERMMHVPAYVEDMAEAERKARIYAENFRNTPEGKATPDAKLTIRSILIGGTLLI